MKFIKPLIAASLLIATGSTAFAANDATDITINVTKDAYVNIIGTAKGNTYSFTTDEIDAKTVSLGTVGLESNSAGNCDMTFSTANGFKLVNAGSGNDLGVYSIKYAGATLTAGAANALTQACQSTASAFDLESPALPASVDAGVYSDVVTVTVATQ